MRIKKEANGNQYLLTPENIYVRNFTRENVPYIDLNETIKTSDYNVFLKNEIKNSFNRYQWVDSELIQHEKVIIISDGYKFQEIHKICSELPRDVAIIGVNGTLAKWDVSSRNMNYYVVNNPYQECMRFFPKKAKFLPKCIASPRTNYEFLANYRGIKMKYYPVNEKRYCTVGFQEVKYQVDDYRNPICAAIGLAYRFGVEKLVLLSCDDTFDDQRGGCIQLENGLYTYEQHVLAHNIMDANLYWLTRQEYKQVEIAYYSHGPKFLNASYINTNEVLSFFRENNEQKKAIDGI